MCNWPVHVKEPTQLAFHVDSLQNVPRVNFHLDSKLLYIVQNNYKNKTTETRVVIKLMQQAYLAAKIVTFKQHS